MIVERYVAAVVMVMKAILVGYIAPMWWRGMGGMTARGGLTWWRGTEYKYSIDERNSIRRGIMNPQIIDVGM
jgi:hypothetical protein